ncbi:glycoside hydrolase family 95 protein [Cellulomonas fengjieae]|uniref:glycoside hydrolase family 95 protein n=1 Tax=Cellulomonas fengjieae TaxID=2819978 RepID=UPI001AAF9643|nr:glycoside hydrolase family 95 protein [Cellulomonas fengjieae]MBO3101496.1 glycoside hydrolase family 95 protein [Cellulomonas fengjieae]
MTSETTLRYDSPATAWTDALPLGNGRLGTMVFGGVARERLQVNDDTCWSGAPRARSAPDGPAALAAARDALDRDDVREAERQVQRLQGGFVQAYQPLVDLWLDQPDATADGYSRWLRLDEAVAGQSWSGGTQEAFVSRPAGVLVVHRTWSAGPGALDVRITSEHPLDGAAGEDGRWSATLRLPSDAPPDYVAGTRLARDPRPGTSLTAAVALEVRTDGVVTAGPEGPRLRDATWVTLVLASATDYVDATTPPHGDADLLRATAAASVAAAAAREVSSLRDEHVADHARLFDRVTLDLGTTDTAGTPTDQRLAGPPDPGLAALAFHYGRYLMIAGSRPGTLPLTLQGIWNEAVRPPWSSNYTININTQMNYWPVLSANLAECHEPLVRWTGELAVAGSRTATELYGLRGWTAHHNSDAWAFAEPVGDGASDPAWSFWPLGGAWLARHLVDQHDFTGEALSARDRAVLVGAARFVLDWLVELPDGSLGTRPATSPENSFIAPDGAPAALSTSTTADLAIVRDLLENVLRLDGTDAEEITSALARLPGERVTADGRLAEWRDDVPEAEPEHRHQSHLFRVHPGTSVDPDQEPALARAALATLDARGPESTGWSLAWRLNLRARLRDAAGAQAMVDAFLRPVDEHAHGGGVYRNLFCAHPPFQIDGNFGFTAGVVELLLQSHRTVDGVRELQLLPTLPPAWPSGSVRGLRARGGVTVDLTWDEGVLVAARLVADRDVPVMLRAGGTTERVHLRAGEAWSLTR